MNHTFNVFQTGKEKARNVLINLHGFLTLGQEMGADIDERLKDKLLNAIHHVDGEKLRVALVGAFSEGKTSIAAAWLNDIEISKMKVSHQESFNPIHVYDVNDQLILIDTPGLFGFNDIFNEDSGKAEKYRELTKKYISEAHLIIYVMNSVNPIKASHTPALKWLFRELQLLPRTVFVLSRFDEVADIEDERDYQESYAIKKASLIKRLDHAIYMSDREKNTMSLVAVSANPFDMGLDYWFENTEKFQQISRIDKLQRAISEKIKANGGAAKIDMCMHNTVIRDVLKRNLPIAIANDEKIEQELLRLEGLHQRLQTQFSRVNDQVQKTQANLSAYIEQYFNDLILQANGSTRESLPEFYQQMLGENLSIVDSHIFTLFEKHMLTIFMQMNQIMSNLKNEVSNYNNAVQLLGVQRNQDLITQDNQGEWLEISTNEDSLSLAHLGLDITSAVRTRLSHEADFESERIQIDSIYAQWFKGDENAQTMAVKSVVEKLTQLLESQQVSISAVIKDEAFQHLLFAQQFEIEKYLSDLMISVDRIKERRVKFAQWRAKGEEIAADFSVFS